MAKNGLLKMGIAFGIGLGIGYFIFNKTAASSAQLITITPTSANGIIMPMSTRLGYTGFSQATQALTSPAAGYDAQFYPNLNKFGMTPISGNEYSYFEQTNTIFVD